MLGIPSSSSNLRRRCQGAFGMGRALTVGILIVGVAFGACLSSAEAHLGESLMGFGEELAKWTNARPDSKEGHLNVNGLEVHRMTVSTPLGIKDSLDRLQRVCQQRGGFENPASLLGARSANPNNPLPGKWDGALRHENNHAGVLTCIDTDRPLGVAELARRMQQFVKTGNLSDVGKLRYVLARREGSVTSLLVLWTEGKASLLDMFPKSGDAPGQDLLDVPRPEGAARLLSASELGSPYGITVYRAPKQSPESLRNWYSARLKERGWFIMKSANANTLAARRAGRTIVIHLAATALGQTAASIAELS